MIDPWFERSKFLTVCRCGGTILINSIDYGEVEAENLAATEHLSKTEYFDNETGNTQTMERGKHGGWEEDKANEKDVSEAEDESEELLPDDTFSFLQIAPPISLTFATGIIVFIIEAVTLAFLALDSIDPSDSENPLQVPPNIEAPVRASQVLAILISVVSQDNVVESLKCFHDGDISEDLEAAGFEGKVSQFRYWGGVFLRFITGIGALATTFMLIIASETNLDLLLNFTAVEFVSQLDNTIFDLAKLGYIGATAKKYTLMIDYAKFRPREEESSSLVPEQVSTEPQNKAEKDEANFSPGGSRESIAHGVGIFNFLTMMFFWAWIVVKQVRGDYLCSRIFVQFGDEFIPGLGTLSGTYRLQPQGFGKVQYVEELDREGIEPARFGYCDDTGIWAFGKSDTKGAIVDVCANPIAFSEETISFDILSTSGAPWTVEQGPREVPLSSFGMSCHDCTGDAEYCGGDNSVCVDRQCVCEAGLFGERCEFSEPCASLEIGSPSSEGFTRLRDYSRVYNRLGDVVVSEHPVLVGNETFGDTIIDVMVFIGRRWMLTSTAMLFEFPGATNATDLLTSLEEYLTDTYHPHWSNYSAEFLSDPVDVDTSSDLSATPEGLGWFSSAIGVYTVVQAPDTSRPVDGSLVCADCNNVTNKCEFEGLCHTNGTCVCNHGAFGTLCQFPPTGDGQCDNFFNNAVFSYDGGDCCEATCVGEGNCGPSYPNCEDPQQVCADGAVCWIQNSATLVGTSGNGRTGASIALSVGGGLTMAYGQPGVGVAFVFDQDGSLWVQRGSPLLPALTTTAFGSSVSLSGDGTLIAVGSSAVVPTDASEVHLYSFDASRGWEDVFYLRTLSQVGGVASPAASTDVPTALGKRVVLSNDGSTLLILSLSLDLQQAFFVVSVLGISGKQWTLLHTLTVPSRLVEFPFATLSVSSDGETFVAQEGALAVQTYRYSNETLDYQVLGSPIAGCCALLSRDAQVLVVNSRGLSNAFASLYAWNATVGDWSLEGQINGTVRALSWDGLVMVLYETSPEPVLQAYRRDGVSLGEAIPQIDPTFAVAVAVSAAGGVLSVGRPNAGANSEGAIASYTLFNQPLATPPLATPQPSAGIPTAAPTVSLAPTLTAAPTEGPLVCGRLQKLVNINIRTDFFPEETRWRMISDHTVTHQGGPYDSPETTYVESMCVTSQRCVVLSFLDAIGDGMVPGGFEVEVDGQGLIIVEYDVVFSQLHFFINEPAGLDCSLPKNMFLDVPAVNSPVWSPDLFAPALSPAEYPFNFVSSSPSSSPSLSNLPSSSPSVSPSGLPSLSLSPSGLPSVSPSSLPSDERSLSPSPSVSPSLSVAPGFDSYVGCFSDGPNRALPDFQGIGMDFDSCYEACNGNGYTHFGLQWNGQCWCGGNGYDRYGQLADGDCNCDGPNYGGWRNCVYQYGS